MNVETRDTDGILLAELDHDTWLLLEDRINWNSEYYAEVCADAIRRDYTLATRRAFARGLRLTNAVPKRLDPIRFDSELDPRYLKRTEEDWFKTFLVGENTPALSKLGARYVIGVLVVACAVWLINGVAPGFGVSLSRQFAIMGPIFSIRYFEVYIKRRIVLQMGPAGCALVNRGAMIVFYLCVMFSVANYFMMIPWLSVSPLIGVFISFAWYGVSFIRKRRRIREHYGAVCRILGLPGADELGDAMPGG